jgi:DNA modification methylase
MTELIWEGKYDKDGKKAAPLRVALPFQTVETVNESAQDRQKSLELFRTGRTTEWRNRLIWGDKKYVLPSLLPELAGKVNLIYIDPPFDTGADFIYVHLDWHVGHYAKGILDEVFGRDNMVNEIIWYYHNVGLKVKANRFHNVAEHLYWYRKGTQHIYHEVYLQRDVPSRQPLVEWDPVRKKTVTKRDEQGNVLYTDLTERRVQNVWEIPRIGPTSGERLDYATQKPEALLERIINASSNPGDLVLDCFCGSGTTAAVAEKLGRRWIACDLSRFAIHTTRKRLLSIPNVKPFIVQNLGKYERQIWQAAEFGEEADAKIQAYRRFILELYHAQPITGYTWLRGLKAGRMVHVGAVDSPVSPGDIAQIAAEFKKAIGTGKDAPTVNGIDILGWDFAFELNEVAKQQAAQANIQMRFLKIPRDVMDKRAVEQGDIQFFELAALSVDVQTNGKTVTLKLTDFVIPPDEVPEEVQRAIKHWSQWIDYWAVDWNNSGDTFHNEWQDYRTRKKRDLQMQVVHTYPEPGEYTIVVKVIDILGNDTTKTIKVKV